MKFISFFLVVRVTYFVGVLTLSIVLTDAFTLSIGVARSQSSPIDPNTVNTIDSETDNLMKQGLQQLSHQQIDLAVQTLKQAVELAQRKGNRISIVAALKLFSTTLDRFEQSSPTQAKIQREQVLSKLSVNELAVFQGWEGIFELNFAGWQLLMDLGDDYAKSGNYTAAAQQYKQAINTTKFAVERNGVPVFMVSQQERGLLLAQARALTKLGWSLEKLGALQEAEKTLRESGRIWNILWLSTQRDDHKQQTDTLSGSDAERLKVFDIGEQQALTYSYLQSVLVKLNQQSKALEASEQVRTTALVDNLGTRILGSAGQGLGNKLVTLEELQKVAHLQNATLIEYSIIYDDIVDSNSYRDSDINPFVSGASTAKQFIEIEELSLESRLPKPNKLLIWVIQPTGKVNFREVELKALQKPLAQALLDSRRSIGVRGRSSSISIEPINAPQDSTQLRQLYQLLIHPIDDLLPRGSEEQVIFIPHRILTLVPFAALQDEHGRYLIERSTISTAPSIRSLSLTHQLKKRVLERQRTIVDVVQPALVVGNPTMPKFVTTQGQAPEQLLNLPGAEQEAQAIAQLFNVSALTGDKATVEKVLREFEVAKLIHLATHGLLDVFSEDGAGAIALAPSTKNSGFLTTSALLNIPEIAAELVVLSACDTARGQITGEGVIGLSRAFITAGVPSVIVSLWSVPDAPTAELMVDFYRNWRDKKMDKAQALRQAMLTTMKTHPNPRDWAAFTLIGEAK